MPFGEVMFVTYFDASLGKEEKGQSQQGAVLHHLSEGGDTASPCGDFGVQQQPHLACGSQQYGCGSSFDDDGGGSPALQPAALGGAHQGAVGGAWRLAAAADHQGPGGDGCEEPV